MLGAYPPKPSTTTNNKPSSKTRARVITAASSESGPKTRSASTRRTKEQAITITYLGRHSKSETDLPASSTTRSSRQTPSVAQKKGTQTAPVATKNEESITSTSSQSLDSSLHSKSSVWASCIDAVNQTGAAAKRENKYIRRLRVLHRRCNPGNFEKDVAKDEHATLFAARYLTHRNLWSLNACHAYLPTITKCIISENQTDGSIALDALEAITDTCLEQIVLFSSTTPGRIGVNVVEEERAVKAKDCIALFREIVRKRDFYYKQMDEESIYKMDNILASLKNV
ncbi:hypothetical protein GCK72_009541 [Caenorhabditis remanei]|uniref:Katanin p80 subunit C-terminal domain-containing protein n=1 Tax=Caenorhabditis remanei TaxID=31234 RepID=A0A6A5H370_CAERE|nr:hypothetical protein GCK72_009541 [Caenorhabditis remanei]KAF1761286.1 hypothetical protein GCK72_009541 [Caenorhabditis remanei]